MPDRWLPPKIWFFLAPELGGHAKEAYLVRINGQPWAFPPDPTSQYSDPETAGAQWLDPKHIVEETNSETGHTYYAYRGEAPADP